MAANATIVAFGDSTTALRRVQGRDLDVYTEILQRELPARGTQACVINAGVPGDTTVTARGRFGYDVLDHDPAAIVIQFGINDAAIDVWRDPPATEPRVPLSEFAANIRFFVAESRRRKAAPVLMTPNPMCWSEETLRLYGRPPYRPDAPEGFNVVLRDYVAAIRGIALETNTSLIDVFAKFESELRRSGGSVSDLLLDGMHPNEAGHRLIANLLLGILPDMLSRK